MSKIRIYLLTNNTLVCAFEQGDGTNILTIGSRSKGTSGNYSMEATSKRIEDIKMSGQVIFQNFEDKLPERIALEEEFNFGS